MFGKLNLKERKREIAPDWAKELISEDVKYFSAILAHFSTIENLTNEINENKEKMEAFKHHDNVISRDIVDNLQKTNFRLASLLNTIKSL